MPLCGVDDFDGALGAVYRCPFCGGRPKTAQPMPEARRGIETLRVYLDTHSEVVFRCHNCGLAAAAPELVGKRSGLPWSQIAERLRHHRVFGDDDDAPEHWVRRAEEWDRFAGMFEKAKAWFRRLARAGRIGEASFAEVGIGAAFLLERALPGVKLVSRWGRRTLFTAELRRSILGLPNHVLIRHRKRGHAVAVFEFGPREPLYLTMPEWVLYRDWADELTVFTDLGLGGELMEHAASHPSGVAPAAAWIADCNGPVADEVPCRTVRYMPTGRESPELGLAFVQPGVRAMVRDEDAVDSVADFIIERTRNSDPIAYLHTVLQKPWVTAAAARLLTEAVAARLGGQATALIARSGASDRVLPYTIRGTTYLCRNGVYAKRRGKGDWQPCANFSLRVEESGLEEDREVAHEILLQMDGRSAGFTALDHELHDGPALLKLAAATAIGEGFPDVPRVLEPGDIGRLPSIVMATQLKPALRTLIPPALGFDRGRFHGHNFTATGRGVAFGA